MKVIWDISLAGRNLVWSGEFEANSLEEARVEVMKLKLAGREPISLWNDRGGEDWKCVERYDGIKE